MVTRPMSQSAMTESESQARQVTWLAAKSMFIEVSVKRLLKRRKRVCRTSEVYVTCMSLVCHFCVTFVSILCPVLAEVVVVVFCDSGFLR